MYKPEQFLSHTFIETIEQHISSIRDCQINSSEMLSRQFLTFAKEPKQMKHTCRAEVVSSRVFELGFMEELVQASDLLVAQLCRRHVRLSPTA